jgi:hypothetical protein
VQYVTRQGVVYDIKVPLGYPIPLPGELVDIQERAYVVLSRRWQIGEEETLDVPQVRIEVKEFQ